MKPTNLAPSVALFALVFGNPLKLDIAIDNVDVHVNIEDMHDSKSTHMHEKPSISKAAKPAVVTLPYEIHQALPDKQSDQTYYNFANIPYAKQPIGERRFKQAEGLSTEPLKNPPFNDGQSSVVCPQEQVGWVPYAKEFLEELFNPLDTLDKKWSKPITSADYKPLSEIEPLPGQNESCLVLDVFVNKTLFDKGEDTDYLAPVIIWIHGGGFIFGSKDLSGDPVGMLEQAARFTTDGTSEDVIVVSVNYRLGAFGWLSSREFRKGGGYENAGLSDQVAAIQWVKDNIVAFNGDPYQITVMGESAGASSIYHHLTAYGGKPPDESKRPQFHRAIMQSPGFFPTGSENYMNSTYQAFLKAAGAKDFKQLQEADTENLMKANRETTYNSPYGLFTYGPVVPSDYDPKDYVQAPPSLSIAFDRYYRGIPVLLANNRREGSIFTPPWLRTSQDLRDHMEGIYPSMKEPELRTEFEKYYPVPKLTTEKVKFLKAAAAFGDLGIDCNAWALRKLGWYEYYYNIYPGFHGQDIGATFWPVAGDELSKANVEEQSQRLQRYLTSFAKFTDPNVNKLENDKRFEELGTDELNVMYMGSGFLVKGGDQSYGGRKDDPLPSEDICGFWQHAPWWGGEEAASTARLLQQQNGWQSEL